MRAGALRDFATIERKIQMGQTKLGEPNFIFHPWLVDLPCEKKSRRGKEHFDTVSHQRYSEIVYQFRFRFEEIEGLDPTMRIVNEDQIYDIKAILPDSVDRRDVVVECTLADDGLMLVALSPSIEDIIANGFVGETYQSFEILAQGGSGAKTFILLSGSLPPGLTLQTVDSIGIVSGTPTLAGEYSAVIQVSDETGSVTTPPLKITIA